MVSPTLGWLNPQVSPAPAATGLPGASPFPEFDEKKLRDQKLWALLAGLSAGLLGGRGGFARNLGQGLILGQNQMAQAGSNAMDEYLFGLKRRQLIGEEAKTQRELEEQNAARAAAEGIELPPGIDPGTGAYLRQYDPDELIKFKLREPEKATSGIQEYNFAKSQGFTGSFQDWKRELAKAGSSSTTVNVGPTGIDYGDPPKDMVWARNPDGTIALTPDASGFQRPVAIPIAGSTLESERITAGEKAAGVAAQREQTADIVVTDLRRSLNKIQESPLWTTGMGGALLSAIPGTAARDVKGLITTVKANIGFDKLQVMRANSPTGAALGPVSDFENQTLQATMGDLEQSQTLDQVAYNLGRVHNTYLDTVHGKGNGPARIPLKEPTIAQPGTPSGGDFSAMSTEELRALGENTPDDMTREEMEALADELRKRGL